LFEKWLKEKLSCYIVKATAGIHNDSKTPHFHYHVIVNEPEGLKISASISGTQGFRNFSKLKQHKDDIVLPKGNDLKVCRKTDQDINCALKYPLKCGLPLPVGCYNVDLPTLTKEAQETFKNAPTRVYKKKKIRFKNKMFGVSRFTNRFHKIANRDPGSSRLHYGHTMWLQNRSMLKIRGILRGN
jgi:hypothetical protein